MKTYKELLSEVRHEPDDRYAYHGTTAYNLHSILKHGLIANTGDKGRDTRQPSRVYLTSDPDLAAKEANFTSYGDPATGTYGRGGTPIVLKVDLHHPKMKPHVFSRDRAYDKKGHTNRSFYTRRTIHPDAITHVHDTADIDKIGTPCEKSEALDRF